MTQPRRPRKKAAARVRPGGAKTALGGATAGREDFGTIVELIGDAKQRGGFDAKHRRRVPPRPRAMNTPDAPFARIIAGARTEDQQCRALEAAALREVELPAEAFVVGESVTAIAITYSGHPRAGLTLHCTRGSRAFRVGLAEVAFSPGSDGARFVSMYRAWLGLGELTSDLELHGAVPASGRKVTTGDVAVGEAVELVVLACKSNALRCRVLGTDRGVTLRTAVRDEMPGAIVAVVPTKQWTHAGHTYLAGKVSSMRADVEALGLVPLALSDQGEWDPATTYWGEDGEPIEVWARPIIARGKRPMFEMEQVIPGTDPEDFDADPIVEAAELNVAGDRAGAREILMKLLARDLRCLDAHAHLGNFEIDRRPERALRHYEMGLSIGVLSLGKRFDGVLPWGLIDNRPFLRNLHGAGLCWWRLGKTGEAAAAFRKMLWLNPNDNQGARLDLAEVEAGKAWSDEGAAR